MFTSACKDFFLFFFILHTNQNSPCLSIFISPAHIKHTQALWQMLQPPLILFLPNTIHSSEWANPLMDSHQSLAHQAESEPSLSPLHQGWIRYHTPGNELQKASSCTNDKPWSHWCLRKERTLSPVFLKDVSKNHFA